MGVAEAMVLEYNVKKSNSNRLFIKKLYSREHAIFKTLDPEMFMRKIWNKNCAFTFCFLGNVPKCI
ncbi:MAG TPA: hypothetical protein DDZ89_09130 [Clostridiales bacterium]|nr:hypothetical protein [Clostridiales bacterium]